MNLKTRNVLVLILSLCCGCVELVHAQKPERQTRPQAKSRPEYTLRVSTKDLVTISLNAEKAPLAKIAAEISKKLKIPVLLGSSAEKLEVTADFKQLTLEPALHMLAPQVYIDYEVNRAPGMLPQPIGIYLNGYDDPEPAMSAVVRSQSQAILIEGNTEDVAGETSNAAEDPTKILVEQNNLTVSAKRQPLSVVLYKIAYELHIPFELRWETSDLVDVDIDHLPLEEAMPRLSPNVRLFVRANLQKAERKPFRMVLVRPEAGS